MKHKNFILSTLLLSGIGLTGVFAQTAIPTAGGNAAGSGGSVSYSVGQVFYSTNSGSSGSAAQGVQQPYEISIVTGLEAGNAISMQCSAYPNPATYFVTLKVENYKTGKLTYQLFDIAGKLLESNRINDNETNIDMHDLVISTYFLKIIQNNKEIKVFKIIKN